MQKYWPYVFFPLTFLLLVMAGVSSVGVYDTGDGVMHHLFARYAFKHPYLLLDHWGKPLYTLLSCPFAQFGYSGTLVFNLICLVSTSWLAWKIAERLKIPLAPIAAPLVIFAPLVLPVSMSGLTEPLFAFVLLWGIYLLVAGRVGLSAIVISFLPFARTEGFFLLPLFAVYFATRRDYKTILFLGTGTVLYSIIGSFHYHDIFWVFTKVPYKGESTYGSGSFFEFVTHGNTIWGYAVVTMALLGLIFYGIANKYKVVIHRAEYFFVVGVFLLFLLLHSIFWWQGLFSSYGLHRVMVCTFPLAILLSLRGIQLITVFLPNKFIPLSLAVLMILLQSYQTYKYNPLPFQGTERERVMNHIAAGLKNSEARIFSANPYFAFAAGKDPFDVYHWLPFKCTCPEVNFKKGDLVVWDSHFAQFDIPFPVQLLEQDHRFKEIMRAGEVPKDKSEESNKFAVVVFEYMMEDR